MHMATEFRIGEAARRATVTVDAIRFYERRRLLPKAPRTPGRYRLYTIADVARPRFIRRVQALGAGGKRLLGYGAPALSTHQSGAYTGDVGGPMLAKLGCGYALCGHSERRQYHHEDDALVNAKVKAALAVSITPILCVGESEEERERGDTERKLRHQVQEALETVPIDRLHEVVVAYEPIWAIGTGKSSNGQDANEVCGLIRSTVSTMFGADAAQKMRIQYGGSVKPENIKEFMGQPEIDGALVGGASLEVESFSKIVNY